MEIAAAQKQVDTWIQEVGVRYFSELTNMAVLTEEVGELARLISRKYGEQSFKKEITESEIKEKISEELADIFFVCVCLANQMEIDLESAFIKSLEKKTTRDKDRHQNNPKLR